MATLYSDQYQDAYVDVPSSKIAPGYQSGDIKCLRFDYTISAGSVPSNADIIKLAKLPKGAMVIDFILYHSDLGGTGQIDIGWAASAELDEDGVAVEAADATGFFANVDLDTAADVVKASNNAANPTGVLKEFGAEVDVQALVDDAWSASSGSLKGVIMYVIV